MSDQARSRRDFLRQAGTVAWATPFILTMAASSAHAQVSCSPAGTACGSYQTPIDMCVPLAQTPVVCCNDCVRGTGAQDQFCFCS